MMPSSVVLKLGRCREHIASLRSEIDKFIGSGFLVAERRIEPGGLVHVVTITQTATIPDQIGLIAGDAVHNLRSALDHLVVALDTDGAGRSLTLAEERRLQFPIELTLANYRKQVANQRLGFVPPATVGMIEAIQLFSHVPNAPATAILALIADLDNSDKHRQLTVSATIGMIRMLSWPSDIANTEFVGAGEHRMEPGIDIGRWTFDRTVSAAEAEVIVDFGIGIPTTGRPSHDAATVLAHFADHAKALIERLSR